jgi:hypothetical protein
MKKLLTSMLIILLVPLVSASPCPKHTHILTPDFNFADGALIFKHLDMDASKQGIQSLIITKPGELITAEVSWLWGPTCPDCTVYVNSFGSWAPAKEVSKVFSGYKGKVTTSSTIPIIFYSPSEPGIYKFRVIFAFDQAPSADFYASNLCTEDECRKRGECHVLIAEGEINVTAPTVNDTLPPSLEIVSPISTAISGIYKAELGSVITIDARADKRVNFTVEIDGKKVSDMVPYSWNTFNLTEGKHRIVVTAIDARKNAVSDEITVILINKTLIYGAQPPLLWTREVVGEVKDIALSSSGGLASAGTEKGFFYLFNKTGEEKLAVKFPGPISKISSSLDGGYIAVSSGKFLYYFLSNGSELWNTSFPLDISDISVSFDGKYIAVGSGNILYYLDNKGVKQWSYSTSNNIVSVSTSAEGDYIAVASGNVIYYLTGNGSLEWTFSAPKNIRSLSMTSDSSHIAATTGDIIYYLDNVASLLWNQSGENLKEIHVTSNGETIFANSDRTIMAMDKMGTKIWRYLADGEIKSLAVSPEGDYVLYSAGKTIYLLDNSKPVVVKGPSRVKYILLAVIVVSAVAIILSQRKRLKIVIPARARAKKPEVTAPKVEEKVIPKEERGHLTVKVSNSKTKRPVKLAKIKLGEKVRETDIRGEAIFDDLPLGRSEISVEKELYEPYNEFFNIETESSLQIELTPKTDLPPQLREQLQAGSNMLKAAYEKVSSMDICLPSYYVSIGERLTSLIEVAAWSPELFTSEKMREETLNKLVRYYLKICAEISEIIVDWRNVKIYRAASELEEKPCEAHDILDRIEELEDLESLMGSRALTLEENLRAVDKTIMSKMGELTIIPVSSLWNIARILSEEAKEKQGVEKAVLVFLSYLLLDFTKGMLDNENTKARLKYALV